jgi:hypothetical protein
VRAYDGRYQIEVHMDEVKELGLGHYQGQSAQGVRRWPLFLCAAQTVLKLIAPANSRSSYRSSTGTGTSEKTQPGKSTAG